ncbi:hypothetical protein DSO57_1010653 [Entomophthora muscae]|uniref:Uncharacterized protein n=1 Tax=Entomophthora muscae TaxID=34485 RepID=A0ACC2RXN3_9FUNG|nr:hypothetical protein DSO57_1010653 [Entomophthora muscae]
MHPTKKSPDTTVPLILAHQQLVAPRHAKLKRDKFLSQISLATAVKIRDIMPQNALMNKRAEKRPSSVEEGYSTELEINIPPNKPVILVSLPVLSNNVATAAPANPSLPCLDKTDVIITKLFVEDEPIDPLHQVVSNDVCTVLTQSQKVALEEEGETIVAQTYAQQIMEMNSGEPLKSEDTLCLENVSIALPFKEMAIHCPSVINSLMQFVESSNNPSIHLVNKNSTYSDCTYCDILVNKVKV